MVNAFPIYEFSYGLDVRLYYIAAIFNNLI